MKRTVKFLGVTFGATALLSLGVACSSRQTPAPSVGVTAPSSENLTPPVGTSAQPGASIDLGTQGQPSPGSQPGALGSGLGDTGPGDTGAAQPRAGTGDAALCDGLASAAKLHVEDVQNGLAIVAVPKAGTSLAAVRDDARRLESSIHAAGGEAHGAQPSAESCGLLQMGRLPGVTTVITEGPSSVRIQMTTSNPSEVKGLRKMGRDEITTLGKKQP